ncbi:holo-ACP synthase [Emcibacter nanhaiensis]|uniref:Holo-[acyl-carrier-protein] synthase n=1 Tax=Emcibacter nanhaiensis TaxID=1505037 RepID=A0A501PRB4_9PROT|nr:holo-ACP synthase [Emcibacter nanhaiensis]TPD62622.1 holo-ACP synthase [Emcibacter nanhaiensis]
MRVLGLGNDLVDIRRIENSLDKYGDRFIRRTFHEVEKERAEARPQTRASVYAKRFAAKEAFSKALGTGFLQDGVSWQDVWVENDDRGRPHIRLAGRAKEILEAMVPEGLTAQIDLTITDDYPWAQAIVLITAYYADR